MKCSYSWQSSNKHLFAFEVPEDFAPVPKIYNNWSTLALVDILTHLGLFSGGLMHSSRKGNQLG